MGAIRVGVTLPSSVQRGAAAGLGLICLIALASGAGAGPSPEEYLARAGEGAKLVPFGDLEIDGRKVNCGRRPTVLDEKSKVPNAVKLWIHAHECGHQYRGPDEETADCFAVQRGRRYGWLTPEGLEEVCRFISPAKGDSMHFSGSHRCEAMRRCYADPSVK
jgi:hypothetical protein